MGLEKPKTLGISLLRVFSFWFRVFGFWGGALISDLNCEELFDHVSGPATVIYAFAKSSDTDLHPFLLREWPELRSLDSWFALTLRIGRMAGAIFRS